MFKYVPAQTFSYLDIPLIVVLFFLELLLSSDNAAVLSFVVRDLPEAKRKSALFVGLFTSFALRAIGILLAAYLIKILWIQILGGLYLVFLGIQHITRYRIAKKNIRTEDTSFWATVFKIEITDLLFAIDSILGAFALVAIYYPTDMISEKLWVIYVGGILGVILIRFATTWITKLLDTYPNLEKIVYFLIAWMGLKLVVEGFLGYFDWGNIREIFDFIFWIGSVLIIIIGFLSTKWDKKV